MLRRKQTYKEWKAGGLHCRQMMDKNNLHN